MRKQIALKISAILDNSVNSVLQQIAYKADAKMSFKSWRLVFLIFYLIKSSKSETCSASFSNVQITCNELRHQSHRIVGEMFTCYDNGVVPVVSTVPDSVVSSVMFPNGTEVSSLGTIEALWIYRSDIRFIPRGIIKSFHNLRLLAIEYGRLLQISRDDFEEFGALLESVSFFTNSLTSLDADVFEHNPNLRHIDLRDNNFKYIHPKFFENLKSLEGIHLVSLYGCNCIHQEFDRAIHGHISSFKWQNSKCTNDIGKVESVLWPIYGRVQHSLNNDICLKEKIETSVLDAIETDNRNSDKLMGRVKEMEDLFILRLNRIENDLTTLKNLIAENINQH